MLVLQEAVGDESIPTWQKKLGSSFAKHARSANILLPCVMDAGWKARTTNLQKRDAPLLT